MYLCVTVALLLLITGHLLIQCRIFLKVLFSMAKHVIALSDLLHGNWAVSKFFLVSIYEFMLFLTLCACLPACMYLWLMWHLYLVACLLQNRVSPYIGLSQSPAACSKISDTVFALPLESVSDTCGLSTVCSQLSLYNGHLQQHVKIGSSDPGTRDPL